MENGKSVALMPEQIAKIVEWKSSQKSVAASCRKLGIKPPSLCRPIKEGYISQRLFNKIEKIFTDNE